MKVTIEIPPEFEPHWEIDRFEGVLYRLITDIHSMVGFYEIETVKMLIKAFKEAEADTTLGHWIDEGVYADGHPHHVYKCSACGDHIIADNYPDTCEKCGAKIIGVVGFSPDPVEGKCCIKKVVKT